MHLTTTSILSHQQRLDSCHINSMLRSWCNNRHNCQMVPIKMEDARNNTFWVQSEYFAALGHDYHKTKWEIISQRSIDWNEAQRIITKKHDKWAQKRLWLANETLIKRDIPLHVGMLIWPYIKIDPKIQFNIATLPLGFGIGLKTLKVGCIICSIDKKNKMWDLTKCTEKDLFEHSISNYHYKNCQKQSEQFILQYN